MQLRTDGLPDLIIDVACLSIWEYDVDAVAGKAWGYLALGIANYLVCDPAGDLLGEGCRGRQRQIGEVRPWRPSEDGRYHAVGLGVSFKVEGSLLRTFDDHDGRPMEFPYKKHQPLRLQEREVQS